MHKPVDLPGNAPGHAPCRGARRPLAQARVAEPARCRARCLRAGLLADSGGPAGNRTPAHVDANDGGSLLHEPVAGVAGNAPASGVLEAPLTLRHTPIAARTGAAPVSLPRQGSRDADRVTSRSLLARSRTASSRLGNERRGPHGRGDGVTCRCCPGRREVHGLPGSLVP